MVDSNNKDDSSRNVQFPMRISGGARYNSGWGWRDEQTFLCQLCLSEAHRVGFELVMVTLTMMTSSHLQYHIRHIYLSEAHRVGFDPFDGDNNYDNDDIFPLCLNEATHRVDFY